VSSLQNVNILLPGVDDLKWPDLLIYSRLSPEFSATGGTAIIRHLTRGVAQR
jgi:hypothetical protein